MTIPSYELPFYMRRARMILSTDRHNAAERDAAIAALWLYDEAYRRDYARRLAVVSDPNTPVASRAANMRVLRMNTMTTDMVGQRRLARIAAAHAPRIAGDVA